MKKKKVSKSKVRRLITDVVQKICNIAYPIEHFEIRDQDERANGHGGEFSGHYVPENYEAVFYVFKRAYEQIPDAGITENFLAWLVTTLCHEAGHTYIWELDGSNRNIEKASTLIGDLLYDKVRPKIKLPKVAKRKKQEP